MSIFFGSGEFFTNLNGNEEDGSEFEILVQAYLRDVHYTSRNGAILNVVYATINAGLVALPMVTEYSGLPLYIAGICLISIFSGYTTCMVINMANEQGVRTLEDLGEKAFGSKGFIIVCIFEIIFSLSLMCVTLDVWAEICANAVRGFFPGMDHVLWVHIRLIALLAGSLIILPICLVARSMASLSWSSYFSVIAIATVLCSLVAAFSVDLGPNSVYNSDSVREIMAPKKLAWTLALVASFCFANNQKVFTVYSCLRRRSSARWTYVVKRAHFIIALFYIIFGVFGYLSDLRLDRTLDNINYFLEFSRDGTTAMYFNIMSLIVALSLLFTMPVDCLVAAITLKRLIQKVRGKKHPKSAYSSVCCCFCCCAMANNWLHPSSKSKTTNTVSGDSSTTADGQVRTDLAKHAYSRLAFPDDASGVGNPVCGSEDCYSHPARHARHDVRSSESPPAKEDKYSSMPGLGLGPQMLDSNSNSTVVSPENRSWHSLADVSSISKSMRGLSDHSSRLSEQDLENGMGELGSCRAPGTRDARSGSIEAVERFPSNLKNNRHRAISSEIDEDCPSSSSFSSAQEDVVSPLPNVPWKNLLQHGSSNNSHRSNSFDGEMPDKRGHSYSETVSCDLAWREARSGAGSSGGRPSIDPVFEGDSEEADPRESFIPVRQSSLGMVMEQPLIKTCTCSDVLPVLLLWFATLVLCASYNKFGILAIMLGPVATAVLVYIFPSMLYFRLGLTTDFATTPICGVIPNRAYMHTMQTIGVIFLLGNIAAVLYTFTVDDETVSL